MTIGEKIKECRKRAGLTQKKLGELSGTSEITIRQYESGKRQPRIEQLKKIATALNVPIWDLLGLSKQEAVLMHGVDAMNQTPYDTKEVSDAILTDVIYEKNFKKLRKAFNLLNTLGQEESIKRIEELAEIPKYQKSEE